LGSPAGGTVVSSKGSLQLVGFSSAEPLSLDGEGFGGNGVMFAYGSNYLSGPVTLTGSATISTLTSNTLITLSNAVSGPGGLQKTGAGLLRLAGNSNNTYAGKTTIADGTLQLAKSNAVAIAGQIEIGDGFLFGGQDAIQWLAPHQIADTSTIFILSSGLLNLNGFSDTIGSLSGVGNVALGTGTLSIGANNLSTTYNGFISGVGGSITKVGSGVLTLTENNDYAGLGTVNGGVLLIHGSQPTTAVLVQNGGLFGGTGLVSSITTVSGQVNPGASPGRLRTGNLQLNSASQFIVELNGTNAGVSYDQLVATGNVGLGGAVLQVLPGSIGAVSNRYVIIRNDGGNAVTGTFLGLAEGGQVTFANGMAFQITYSGGDGNDVVLTQLSQPTPPQVSAIVMLGNGQIQITGAGLPGVFYTVEANADLNTANWVPLSTITPQGNTLLEFIDTNAPAYPQRFYRFRWP
jgi:autotransporter-associated beta strand protein